MQNKSQRFLTAILLALLLASILFVPAMAQKNDEEPVVRAVLFYSPTCPHCEEIIQNFLPPVLDQYGEQLKIVAIDISLPEGQALYQATVDHFLISDDRLGVPTLVVEDIIMVGSGEIPAMFPGLIEEGLTNSGTDWPEVPGLAAIAGDVKPSSEQQTSSSQSPAVEDDTPPMFAKFLLDPVANSVAVIALIVMVASIVGVVISFTRPVPEKDFWPKWVIPILSVLGMGVAFYLTYVETSGVEAFCGPVGDCNSVQLSPYATLFGVLPVGILGLIGYALILAGWAFYHFGPKSFRWASAISVWGMAFFGVLFSIYLTFLEPFVIGATCMWCISSAIIMTLVFLAATGPAKRAWHEDDFEDDEFEDEENELEDSEEDILQEETTEAETANFEEDEASIAEPEEASEKSVEESENPNETKEEKTEE